MVGLTASFVITAGFNLHLLKKTCPEINYAGYLIRSIIICAAVCTFGRLFANLFDGVLPTVWKIVVCGSVVGVFAVLAFYGMEMLSARPIKKLFNRA